MRRYAILVAAALWAAGAVPGAAASEQVRELWRSRYGTLRGADANPKDGSLWLLEGATVTRLAEDGSLLVRSSGLGAPAQLALDPRDGSCWVHEAEAGRLFHFSATGEQVAVTSATGPTDPDHPALAMAVSPFDGSLWAALPAPAGSPGWVGHFARDGTQLWHATWSAPSLVPDGGDDSAWVVDADAHAAVHVRGDGMELTRVYGVAAVFAEDPRDGSVWGGDILGDLAHFPTEGGSPVPVANPDGVLGEAVAATVSPLDGSVWVRYHYSSGWLPAPGQHEGLSGSGGWQVAHLSASGEALGTPGIGGSVVGSGAPDGSVWVAAPDGLIQISASDEELRRLPYPYQLLAYQPRDNSFWVQDLAGKEFLLRHVAQDGSVVSEEPAPVGLAQLPGRSVDARDGSCWVYENQFQANDTHLVNYSPEGTELGRRDLPDAIYWADSLSISPLDGSWWVTAEVGPGGGAEAVFHYAADGRQISRHDDAGGTVLVDPRDGSAWAVQGILAGGSGNPQLSGRVIHYASTDAREAAVDFGSLIQAPALDPRDGSLWLVETDEQASWKLAHLSVYGATLAELPVGDQFQGIASLAVSPGDGSVFGVSGAWPSGLPGEVFRITREGALLWSVGDLWSPTSIALDPRDSSAWIAVSGGDSSTGSALLHLAADGTELSRQATMCGPWAVEFSPYDGTIWVTDVRNGQLVHLRAQPATGPFPDVPRDFWAVLEVEACVSAGITQGYADGTYRPNQPVTRDQMAVYIARALAGGDGKVTAPATAVFADVPAGSWAFRYVEYCRAKWIVTGYPDGLYHPGEPVTRAQLAVYLARCSEISTPPAEAVFPDVPVDYWAAGFIAYCKDRGIVQGYPDGTYQPEEVVDRAQMAVYVSRAFELS